MSVTKDADEIRRFKEVAHREVLQANAWAEALRYAHDEGYFTRAQLEALQESNPYRVSN